MINFLRWFFGLGPTASPRYARVDLDEWRSLAPGEVKVMHDDATGHSWALMYLDDFDHIADRARLRRADSPTTVSPEQTS